MATTSAFTAFTDMQSACWDGAAGPGFTVTSSAGSRNAWVEGAGVEKGCVGRRTGSASSRRNGVVHLLLAVSGH